MRLPFGGAAASDVRVRRTRRYDDCYNFEIRDQREVPKKIIFSHNSTRPVTHLTTRGPYCDAEMNSAVCYGFCVTEIDCQRREYHNAAIAIPRALAVSAIVHHKPAVPQCSALHAPNGTRAAVMVIDTIMGTSV